MNFNSRGIFKLTTKLTNMKEDVVIYYLTIEDLQYVASNELERKLSHSEIENVKEKVAEKIDWYEEICFAISESVESSM